MKKINKIISGLIATVTMFGGLFVLNNKTNKVSDKDE